MYRTTSFARRPRRLQYWALVSALLALATVAPPAWAGDAPRVFTENGAPAFGVPSGEPGITRTRALTLAQDPAAFLAQPTLVLNLFADVNVTAQRIKVAHPAPGANVWVGRVVDDPYSSVTLAVRAGVLVGTVHTRDGLYQIEYMGDGTYEAREVDATAFPDCPGPVDAQDQPASFDATRKPSAPTVTPFAETGARIDVMVLYTATARIAAGGTAAMVAEIDGAIAMANQTYANSGIVQRLRCVHTAEVAYVGDPVTMVTDFTRLRSTTDGILDGVHALRDRYRADVVSLIRATQTPIECGIGQLLRATDIAGDPIAFATEAFNVVARTCFANRSLTHELGHNFGCSHERANTTNVPSFPYAFGYQDPSTLFRTIMSTNTGCNCPRVAFFSNLVTTFGGFPLGVADSEDNTRAQNNTAVFAANWRLCVEMERASVTSAGAQVAQSSGELTSLSATGRYVVFKSSGAELTPSTPAGGPQIYLRDRAAGTTELISIGAGGVPPDEPASEASIGGAGRFVAFTTTATNLGPASTSFFDDIFLKDRQTGDVFIVSVATDGTAANDNSASPDVSTNGKFVVFESGADNLVPDDMNFGDDIFFRDIFASTTELISVGAIGSSSAASVSADGRFVAFHSTASNLVPGDTNGRRDVFVRDRTTGTTTRVSVTSAGGEANHKSLDPDISADGRYVAFRSQASNLSPDDTDIVADVYLHDRTTGNTRLISRGLGGAEPDGFSRAPHISDDGRRISFNSAATNLVANDTNGTDDVFVWDRDTDTITRVNETAAMGQATIVTNGAAISADGSSIAFSSQSPNLVPNDTNGQNDVFVTDICPDRVVPPPAPSIAFTTGPPTSALGGDPIALEWELADFVGPITRNQAHFGIVTALGSSDVKAATNGTHSHTFAAPNVGTFDSPVDYTYAARALDNGAEVLSPFAVTSVSAGPTPPTVAWIIPPPAQADSPGNFTVSWRVSNYVDPTLTNEFVAGDTGVQFEFCNQPGGNGDFSCLVNIPAGAPPGGVSFNFAAFAQNPIEFALTPIMPVLIGGP